MKTTIFIHKDMYSASFKPASRCLLLFKMNSRQEYLSKLSFYNQNTGFSKPDTRSDHFLKSYKPRGGGTPIHYLYGYVAPKGVVILKLLI